MRERYTSPSHRCPLPAAHSHSPLPLPDSLRHKRKTQHETSRERSGASGSVFRTSWKPRAGTNRDLLAGYLVLSTGLGNARPRRNGAAEGLAWGFSLAPRGRKGWDACARPSVHISMVVGTGVDPRAILTSILHSRCRCCHCSSSSTTLVFPSQAPRPSCP